MWQVLAASAIVGSAGVGVGVGMMYMMSAWKAEMDRLNTAVDETAKVVLELKAEISKRKSLYDSKDERNVNQKRSDNIAGQSSCGNDDIIEDYGFPMSDEGNMVEMGQLEAELECELLKLQVSTTENLSSLQNETSTENLSKPQDPISEFNQCNGIMPFELDNKLCHLLLEQEESQIVDLESELQRTNSKLVEKESELQALKDCVKRLTEFSLTCPSDDERECQVDGTHSKINGDGRSMIGIKRTIDYGFPMSDEGGYASSILTEEPHRDVVEMGQLEAELECELLKLQVSTTETLSSLQNETSTENLSKPQDPSSEFNQCNGVMPYELDNKLCHLLLEQQESQIVDLESELQRTNSKLVEKESELQALKDCVKRLTDFSLTCPSEDERECQVDETHSKINSDGRSMIGIKRSIDFD